MTCFKYIEKIKEIISVVETAEKENIKQAVAILVNAIEQKKALFTFGASHAGILSEEMFYRAGGLVVINPIFGREIMLDTSPVTHTSHMERLPGYGESLMAQTPLNAGDVLIIHSVSGRNNVSIEVAEVAKKRGATVIGLTNLAYSKSVSSRHPSGKKLFELCDVVLDNHGDIGDASISIEGMEQKVGPTSTVIGTLIINNIIAETIQTLVDRGMKTPPIFYSANLDGGDESNKKIYEQYRKVIHYKL